MYKKGKFFELSNILTNKAILVTESRSAKIRDIIQKTLIKEQDKFFPEMSYYMGKYNKPNLPFFEKVSWSRLKPSTVARKGNSYKWYSHLDSSDGEVSLRDFFRRSAKVSSYYPENKILHKTFKKRTRIYAEMAITPSLAGKRKPFNVYDDTFGKRRTQETKLTAVNTHTGLSNEEMRPLIRPMTEYYVRHKLVRAINVAMRSAGFKKDKFVSG